MASEQFSLCWDNFHKNMSSGMNSLLENEDLVDVTLAVEGKYLKAHKMVLSVCSPYFKELFKTNPCKHPIVFMKDVSYVALSDLLQFMYQGEVQVSQENLSTFIKTAEALQIKGLTGDGNGSTESELENDKSVQQIVDDFKSEPYKQISSVNRPKKIAQTMPTHSAKRQRLSTSTNESLTSIGKLKTKSEPDTSDEIHFKMEPYEQAQTITVTEDDEQFEGDSINETVGEETEDYSMMEGNDDEPQAGTSADGTGEGQDFVFFYQGGKHPVMVINDYIFFKERVRGTRTKWHCLRKSTHKCKARIISYGSTLEIVQPFHNHSPTYLGNKHLTPKLVKIIQRPPRKVYI